MRILLDESVPQKLRLMLGDQHSVATTCHQTWSGLKNGELLTAAEAAGFELFVSADQELAYQQNLAGRRIAVLILSTNNWSIIRAEVERIAAAVDSTVPGQLMFLDIGHGRG